MQIKNLLLQSLIQFDFDENNFLELLERFKEEQKASNTLPHNSSNNNDDDDDDVSDQ